MGFKKGISSLLFIVPVVLGELYALCMLRKFLISPGLVPPQKRATCPDGVHSAANAQCCSLFQVRDDLLDNLFENECGDEVLH